MKSINLELSVNSTSLGNVSFNFLKEFFKLRNEIETFIYPCVNQMDFKSFQVEPEGEFAKWIRERVNVSLANLDRDRPSLRNWHISGSHFSSSNKPNLYTYYETDSPTEEEVSIVSSLSHTFFSSSFAEKAFRKAGANNTSFVPLGFDEDINLALKSSQAICDEVINFGLMGKFEFRKNTERIIKNWLRKYGDNTKYQLNLLVSNKFIKDDDMNKLLYKAMFNRNWRNVNVLPFFEKSSDLYQCMNYIDIDLTGLSGGEGWNLPSFNSTAIGKWSVVSNCSAHKDWANSENCILIEPENEKIPAEDGMFFHKGEKFNQGNFFYISDEKMIEGMEIAEKLAKKVNLRGLELQNKFTYEKSVKLINSQLF